MTKHTFWWKAVLAVLLVSGITMAQVSTGTISGTVTDSSGAVVPGATVVILNQDTGISRTVQTNANGYYSAPSLSLGSYKVTSSRQGFKTQIQTGIVLTVAQEETVNLSMTVGDVAQTVEVTGAAPLLETTTAAVGSLVSQTTIRSLPLNGRSWDQLAESQPGVVISNAHPVAGQGFGYGSGETFTVGGGRPVMNAFLLDGIDMNDQTNSTPGGAAGLNLGVDTILEFKVFTTNWDAEFGHSMGSVTTAVTRSGTNEWHGTGFEYIRNKVLDTRNYFDPASGPPPFIRNQYGGVIGGPIKRNKTWIFGGYEGLRQGLGTTQTAFVPNANARKGILPCTGTTPPCVNGSETIPVNPAVVPYLDLYPLPNGRDFGNGAAVFTSSPTAITNEDNYMVRVDHQLNAKISVFGRYEGDEDSVTTPYSLPFQSFGLHDHRQYATIQANTILSARLLNNFRFGWQRGAAGNGTTYTSAVSSSLSFVPGEPLGTIALGAVGGTSGSTTLTTIGPTLGNGPFFYNYDNFQWADDLTYVAGKHSFKTGVNVETIFMNTVNNSALWGAYTFTGFTEFLEGTPSNLQANYPLATPKPSDVRQNLLACYAQDNYKITRRLTLDLGFRWEASTDPYDAAGRTEILPTTASPNTVPWSTFYTSSKLNFEPRVSFAWQLTPSGKTVLRGGAGIFHNTLLWYFYQSGTHLPPYGATYFATNPSFPNGVAALKPSGSPLALLLDNPHQKTPVEDQFTVSLQQQIFKDTMVEVTYVGNRAFHLPTEIEANSPTPIICSTSLANCPTGIANGQPYYAKGSPRQNPAWAGLRYYQTDGIADYSAGTVTLRHQSSKGFVAQVYYTYDKAMNDSSGDAPPYNGRSPQAIMYAGDYRRDWGPSDLEAKQALVGYVTYPLPFKVSSKALGAVTNGWKLDSIFTYESGLPFTVLLSSSNSNNLSSAGIAERPNLKSGFSSNPIHGVSAGCTGFAGGPVGNTNNWYDPCAFSYTINGTYGNLGRNTLVGPGLVDLDSALEKNFPLREQISMTFRAEAFNIINHPDFGLPATSALAAGGAANPEAGAITDTIEPSRELQFGLRINF